MKLTRRPACWGIALALCFAGGATARVETAPADTAHNAPIAGGVYVNPYVTSINRGPTYVICEDFTNDVQANDPSERKRPAVTDAGSNSSQDVTTTDSSPSITPEEYDTAALLAENAIGNMWNTAFGGGYSYAIWSLFDPAAIPGHEGNSSTGSGQNGVGNLFGDAAPGQTGGGTPDFGVPFFKPASPHVSPDALVVSTPEPSLPAALGVDLVALAGVIFLLRRRLATRRAPR